MHTLTHIISVIVSFALLCSISPAPPPPPPHAPSAHTLQRGGDCNTPFLPHVECVCYDHCPHCYVEFELDANFDKKNVTRPDQERDLPLTVTSRDLVR